MWSLIALACRGHGPESPYLSRGLAGWKRFLVEDGDRLRPEACQSPVWDTGLALLALRAADVPADEPALRRAAEWLLGEEVRQRGDWAIRRPGLEPGGWSFEYDNDLYPDVDDAAVVALALDDLGTGRGAIERACRWMAGMQSANGGWGAFDADNDAEWLYKIPFCDFGAVTDPPSADVTAHVVELLAREGGYEEAVRRGVDYLLAEQEEDGSWFGRWGVNYVYGVARGAARRSRRPASRPTTRRCAVRSPGSRRIRTRTAASARTAARTTAARRALAWRGRGESTPSQTAWALIAPRRGRRGRVGLRLPRRRLALRRTQKRNGGWDEQYFTGTGFPRDFLINYHLYREVWPVLALGRVRRALGRREGLRHRRDRLRRGPRRPGAARAGRRRPGRARRPPRPSRAWRASSPAATPSSTSPRSTATTPRPRRSSG